MVALAMFKRKNSGFNEDQRKSGCNSGIQQENSGVNGSKQEKHRR